MTTLLITGAGGPAGSSLGAQLAARGRTPTAVSRLIAGPSRVIGVDMAMPQPEVATLFDDFLLVPRADDPAFLPVVRAIVRRHGVDVVVPTVQEELPLFAAIGDLLGARVVIGPSAGVALAQDKLFTMWALRSAGVSVPCFAAAEDVTWDVVADVTADVTGDATADATGDVAKDVTTAPDGEPGGPTWVGGLPLVVKPRTSRGGRGVRVVDDAAEWGQIEQAGPGHIVQSFAAGAEYAVQVYVSPGSGEVTAVVLAKTALKQGRVGNAAGVRRSQADEDVAAVAVAAVDALGLVGPVDVDVRRTDDGTPVVLEVNARFGANSAHAPELLDSVLRDYAGRFREHDPAEGSIEVSRGVA